MFPVGRDDINKHCYRRVLSVTVLRHWADMHACECNARNCLATALQASARAASEREAYRTGANGPGVFLRCAMLCVSCMSEHFIFRARNGPSSWAPLESSLSIVHLVLPAPVDQPHDFGVSVVDAPSHRPACPSLHHHHCRPFPRTRNALANGEPHSRMAA